MSRLCTEHTARSRSLQVESTVNASVDCCIAAARPLALFFSPVCQLDTTHIIRVTDRITFTESVFEQLYTPQVHKAVNFNMLGLSARKGPHARSRHSGTPAYSACLQASVHSLQLSHPGNRHSLTVYSQSHNSPDSVSVLGTQLRQEDTADLDSLLKVR